MYCGLSTASEVFLIFTTQLLPIPIFKCVFSITLFSDEPEVFLPKYSRTAICHAAHFQRVVKCSLNIPILQMNPMYLQRDRK